MRMADQRLPNRIQLVLSDIDDLEAKRGFVDAVDARRRITPLVVEKRPAVGHQVLEIPDLRRVDRRIEHLGQNTGRHGVPDTTCRRIGRTNRVLRTAGPPWRQPRAARRDPPGLAVDIHRFPSREIPPRGASVVRLDQSCRYRLVLCRHAAEMP